MKDIILAALPFVLEGGVIALLTFLITISQVKRRAVLNNDGTAINNKKDEIGNLSAIIDVVTEQNNKRQEENAELREELKMERAEKENAREENTAVKMMMCIHMGCYVRTPMMGQGDNWYNEHRSEPSLGCDYLTIEQLIEKHKREHFDNNPTE